MATDIEWSEMVTFRDDPLALKASLNVDPKNRSLK